MGTTTSNQDLGVTTKTSDHSAETSGATDVCWNPPVKVTVPHTNKVSTTKATEHTSTRTKFSEGEVVRVGDAIGPPSDDAHGDNGAGGGVGSHTYRMEARITKGSPNVKAEGKPIGRKTDPTSQNHGNTVGSIQGGNPNSTVSELDAEKLLACSLDTIKVVCGHGRECGTDHGLEITSEDTVKFTATRKNAKTGGAPTCSKPPHTKWVITQKKKGKLGEKKEMSGDEITLPNDPWFTWGKLDQKKTSNSIKQSLSVDKDKAAQDGKFDRAGTASAENDRLRTTRAGINETDAQTRSQGRDIPSSQGGLKASRQESRAELVDAAVAKKEAAVATRRAAFDAATQAYSAGKTIYEKTTKLMDLWEVYNADKEFIEVTVEAFACSGGDKYVIRSFPGKEIEWSISKETIDKLVAAFEAIKKVFKGVQKIATLAGAAANGDAKILKDVEFKIAIQWEEMKEDNAALNKYKHHCDRGWSWMLSATLAEVEYSLGLPVALFANLFVPGGGSALNSALNFIGFEATIGFDVTFKISVGVWGERKPGASSASCGGGFPLELEIFARVKIKWGDVIDCAGGISVKGEPKLQIVTPSINLLQAYVKLLPGEVKIGFKGYVKVNLYFWKYNWNDEYYPDTAKITWSEVPFKFMALLKT
jgi:hypothetical protein